MYCTDGKTKQLPLFGTGKAALGCPLFALPWRKRRPPQSLGAGGLETSVLSEGMRTRCLPPACHCTILHSPVRCHCQRGPRLMPCPAPLAVPMLPIPMASGRRAQGVAVQSTRQLLLSLALQEGSRSKAGVCCPPSCPRCLLQQDPSPGRWTWHHPLLPVPIPHLPPPPAKPASPAETGEDPEMACRGETFSDQAGFAAPPGDGGGLLLGYLKAASDPPTNA